MTRSALALSALLFGLFAFSTSACVKGGGTTETRPVTADIGRYRTCALALDAAKLEEAEPDASAFQGYLEGRLRERGVLEPVDLSEPLPADLTLRLRIVDAQTSGNEASVRVAVDVVETRSHDSLGEIEFVGSSAKAIASESSLAVQGVGGSPRRLALHHAADEIVAYLREKRAVHTDGSSSKDATKSAAEFAGGAAVDGGVSGASAPTERLTTENPADDPFAAPSKEPKTVCMTRCDAPSSTFATQAELSKMATNMERTMLVLRDCLDRIGGQRIEPAVILRFSDGGRLAGMRFDMGGFEDLVCVDAARTRPPAVRAGRPGMLRCVHHCW